MNQLNDFSKLNESKHAYAAGNINLLFYDLPKHFSDEYRSYDAPRLCTIIEGAKEVSINYSEAFTYKKDCFVLLPPHANVNLYMPEHTRALVYEFGDQMIEEVSRKVSDHLQTEVANKISYDMFLLEKLTKRIEQLGQRVLEIFYENDRNMTFLIDLVSQEMVYELLKIRSCNDIINHHHNHPINRAIRMMNSARGDFLTVQEIAQEVDMQPSNFSQQFKLITNQTPKDYMTGLRLKKSKKYLKNLSVTDTALELGYDNISHFIRLFKLEYGMTPKQYQLNKSALRADLDSIKIF